jgi:predicted hydrolase (HD superfamily)
MPREEFLKAVEAELKPNIVKHSLALEACMGGIYDYLKERGILSADELPRNDWTLAGLVHDIDYQGAAEATHPTKVREFLAKYNLDVSDEVFKLIQAHSPETSGVKPESQAEWAIFCADSLTGLIVAVALVYPSRKLGDVKLKSVMKRFLKEPRFAAGTRREEIKMCEEKLGIPLEDFVSVCLESMKKISNDLGL